MLLMILSQKFLLGFYYIRRPDNAENNLYLGYGASFWGRRSMRMGEENKKEGFNLSLLLLSVAWNPIYCKHTLINGIVW